MPTAQSIPDLLGASNQFVGTRSALLLDVDNAPHRNWRRPTNTVLTYCPQPIICECMIDEEFQLKVEQFIKRHDLTPTTFGLWAMNDSRFVFDLRSGRACFGTTIRKVYRFMDEYEAKQQAKKLRHHV